MRRRTQPPHRPEPRADRSGRARRRPSSSISPVSMLEVGRWMFDVSQLPLSAFSLLNGPVVQLPFPEACLPIRSDLCFLRDCLLSCGTLATSPPSPDQTLASHFKTSVITTKGDCLERWVEVDCAGGMPNFGKLVETRRGEGAYQKKIRDRATGGRTSANVSASFHQQTISRQLFSQSQELCQRAMKPSDPCEASCSPSLRLRVQI